MSIDVWNHLERMGSKAGGDISTLASAPLHGSRLVTAVKNKAGNLEVATWQLHHDGTVEPLDSKPADWTSHVAVCGLSEERFVTAAGTEGRGLKLIAWDVSEAGEITRLGSSMEREEIHGEFALAVVDSNPAGRRGAGLIPRPFADFVVVTAIRDSEYRLKLISWEVSNDGQIKRLHDVVDEKVAGIAIAPYDPYPAHRSCLATAVITATADKSTGSLKIIAWAVASDGSFTRLGEAMADKATSVAAATVSHRRIVTASTTLQNQLTVQTWDFASDGAVSLHASAHEDGVSAVAVTTSNTARVTAAARDTAGHLKLIVWDVVDDVVRLGTESEQAAGLLSIVALGSDWLATPVQTSAKTLKIIIWREHAVSLLIGEWPAPVNAGQHGVPVLQAAEDDDQDLRVVTRRPAAEPAKEEPPSKEDGTKPPAKLSAPFEPGIEGVQKDPMIAVGFNYMIVSQAHEIGFFDKSGNLLTPKKGEKVSLSTTEFFASFLEPTRLDGSLNEHDIQRHMGLLAANRLFRYPPGHSVDPDKPLDPPSIVEFYDTRVHFDPVSRRFYVFAPARNEKLKFPPPNQGRAWNTSENPYNRRYWAIAVSKEEDPREGFYQWMSTEAYVADGPEFTVNHDVLVIAKKVHPGYLNVQPMGLRPLMWVLSVEDLVAGKPYPRSRKFFPPEFPSYDGGEVVPVTHYGDTAGRTFLVQSRHLDGIAVYSFRMPSDWLNFPPLEYTATQPLVVGKTPVEVGSLWQEERPKFRNGKIYFTWMKLIAARVPNGSNARFSLRVVRLPLTSLLTKPTASLNKSDGFLYGNIGTPADDDSNLRSYEQPTIAVDKNENMVILFSRIGFDTNPLPPEMCCYTWYAGESGPRASQVIRSGTGARPTWINADDTVKTVFTPQLILDYQTAVVDPADDQTIWMISEYGDNGNYRTVVGSVKP